MSPWWATQKLTKRKREGFLQRGKERGFLQREKRKREDITSRGVYPTVVPVETGTQP
jgi:hypothetical protein